MKESNRLVRAGFTMIPTSLAWYPMSSGKKSVFLSILSRAFVKDGMRSESFPSIRRLAIESRMSKDSVQKYVNELVKDGWLTKKKGGWNKQEMRNHANSYIVNDDKVMKDILDTVSDRDVLCPQQSYLGPTPGLPSDEDIFGEM